MYDRCTASLSASGVGPVHHVVVHERERVEQLEGGADVDDHGVVRVAAGAHERPVAERGSQSLPPGAHEVAERRERLAHLGRHRGPAQDLGVEHRQDALVGTVTDGDEARGEGHAGHGCAEMHSRAW